MTSKAKTVNEYLGALPADRRVVLSAVREVFLKNLDKDYEEGMQYGMIGYYVPHKIYPPGYGGDPKQPLPFAGMASRKNHLSIYISYLYQSAAHLDRFRKAWAKTGKKLDMGKACIRFKKLEDLPLDVVGGAIKRMPVKEFIKHFEAAITSLGQRKRET